MSILELYRVAHRRRGESVRDILQADPSIGFHAVEAIHYKKIDDYNRFVEAFLAEEFPGKYRPQCEACGASCIVDMRCEACFERMESFFVKRATRNSYYQNPGDFEVKLKSYVLLAVRKSLPNNPASGRSPERQLSFALSL